MTDLPQPTEALIVRPGDTLIVRYGHGIARDDFDRIVRELRELLPRALNVLVVTADQLAAYRPGESDTP